MKLIFVISIFMVTCVNIKLTSGSVKDGVPLIVKSVDKDNDKEAVFHFRGERRKRNTLGDAGVGIANAEALSSSTTEGKQILHNTTKEVAVEGGIVTGITKPVKKDETQKFLVIPDRTPANFTPPAQSKAADNAQDEDEKKAFGADSSGNFDDKAFQRAIIVIGGIAVIIVAYLGIKFVLIKKRAVVKRYGRVEASEMDLLDEVDDEESEEEEELFDINLHQQRRS